MKLAGHRTLSEAHGEVLNHILISGASRLVISATWPCGEFYKSWWLHLHATVLHRSYCLCCCFQFCKSKATLMHQQLKSIIILWIIQKWLILHSWLFYLYNFKLYNFFYISETFVYLNVISNVGFNLFFLFWFPSFSSSSIVLAVSIEKCVKCVFFLFPFLFFPQHNQKHTKCCTFSPFDTTESALLPVNDASRRKRGITTIMSARSNAR